MNLLEALLGSEKNDLVNQISSSVGLGENQTRSVIEQLVPALASGLKRNTANPSGLSSLLGALGGGNHQRYLDHADLLTQSAGISEGNAILGHIFGSKDVSRTVAANAEAKTGVSSEIIKRILPMVAAAAMGALARHATTGGESAAARKPSAISPNSSSMLMSMLDADGDGSVMDDLFGMAKKLF